MRAQTCAQGPVHDGLSSHKAGKVMTWSQLDYDVFRIQPDIGDCMQSDLAGTLLERQLGTVRELIRM